MSGMDVRETPEEDARLFAPATARNREPILSALKDWVAPGSRLLEIASGSGEHAMHCAGPLAVALWQPSDPDPHARRSIAAWRAWCGRGAIAEPLAIDATLAHWPLKDAGDHPFDTVLSINMVHIAPWAAAQGLFAGAALCLAPGGRLILYGPFKKGGLHTAPSNEVFDQSLRARDPAWGVRDRDDLNRLAAENALVPCGIRTMPANNHILVFSKETAGPR
ncbi:MAG: DUF938 domain-containing protein [Alphaproteobacteria bacterium]